ncbi:MAG: TRAP transporter substrate-binding protein [Enterocloster sp.]
MKKKVLSLVLSAAMVCSMAGCGLKSPEPAATTAAATEAAKEAATEAAADGATEAAKEQSEAGNVPDASGDPQVTLVYAEVNPLDTIVGQTDSAFKEKVEELSGGSIKVDLQASGVLGAEADILDSMVGHSGTVDMARLSVSSLTNYGTTKGSLLALPYVFSSRAHFWNFAKSDVADQFLSETEDLGLGIKGLVYGEEGFRHFFTVNPVNSMADLKGLKLRVSSDPVMVGTVESFGASATVVAFTELYSALQTGVVDGAEQPIANYKSNAFPEVAPNLILDGHQLGLIEIVITEDAWNKLTEAQQACVVEAANYAADFNANLSETEEGKVLDELKASGVTVVEVEDKTPWQDAVKDVVANAIKGQEDLYQQILDCDK